jgi:DNA-binding MarR family transcriptional regulator
MGKGRPPAELHQFLPLYDIGGEAYFGYRMVIAAKLFDRRVMLLLAEHGDLSLPQWRIVAQLGLNGTGTVKSLAEGAAVDRAEVSRAMRDLERRKLVLRRTARGTDRRSPAFELTAAGKRSYRTLRRPISRFISRLVEDVARDDLKAADRVLFAITRGCLLP